MNATSPRWAPALGLLVSLSACSPSEGTAPPAAASVAGAAVPSAAGGPSAAEGPAQLVFEEELVDLGTISDEGTYTATFPFHNAGGETLRIREVNGGCKCVTATIDRMTLEPGERGVLTAVLKPTRQDGPKPRPISVLSNTPGERSQVTLTATIEPLLRRDPERTLWGERPPGAPVEFLVDLTYRDPDLEFQPVRGPAWLKPWIEKADAPDANGFHHAVLSLKTDSLPWGVHEGGGALRLKIPVRATPIGTGAPVRTEYEMIVMGKALGEIVPRVLAGKNEGRVDSRLDLGVVPAGRNFEFRLRLERQGGQPLQATGAEIAHCTVGEVLVRTEPYGLSAVDVVLFGKAPERQNVAVKGAATVSTDLPGYERLTIDFQGVIR